MKNFTVAHMEENGTAKKTLSRKEYDEQLQMKFSAKEEERHEKLSAEAKEEFEKKTDAEKQEFMNTINDVENKPLTYDLIQALKEHKDITFYCIASTGLNTEDKDKTIKGANGYEKRHIVKDEPTLFKAESYGFDANKNAYVPKNTVSVFIEASEEVVNRAIQSAEAGGYDVFANPDFNLQDYLSGKDVKSQEDAKAIIGNFFEKTEGIVICYGEFHEKMLRGNDFPIPADSIDLNRVMGEQGTFGTASLNKCVNQILKTSKENILELSSTTEKLAADVICLNKIASVEMENPVKIFVREELIDKFSDKDRETVLGGDENIRLEIMPRMRQRRPEQIDRMRGTLRKRDISDVDENREVSRRTLKKRESSEREENDEKLEAAPIKSGFVRRVPKGDSYANDNTTGERPERSAKLSKPVTAKKTAGETDFDFFAVDEAKETEKKTAPTQAALEKDDFDDFFSDQASSSSDTASDTQTDTSELQSRDEKSEADLNLTRQNEEALKTAGLGLLVQAIMEQNKLLQERNELSMKQNEIEKEKVAEMQRQSELIEQQTKQMEKLTLLMDNLTKVYSRADVEMMRMDTPILPKTEAPAPKMPVKEGVTPMRQRSNGAFVRRAPKDDISSQMTARKEEISRMNGDTKELLAGIMGQSESQELDIEINERELRKSRPVKQKNDDIVELP